MATANNTKEILVYADWEEADTPKLMGVLSAQLLRGKEVFSFEYDEAWITENSALYIDPELQMYSGKQYLNDTKPNFGIFLDSSPDRWGKVLMKRREALMARRENRKEKKLYEADFLLGVYDEHRMGGLRFKLEEGADFLNNDKKMAAPPWASLRELEHAVEQLEKEQVADDDEYAKWLGMLIAPGSSLGGARPKASIIDKEGNLWIAKFASVHDEVDVAAWEMLAQQLASKAGIRTSETKLQKLAGKHNTFLTKRFDRTGNRRIHFASAMTLLGYKDGDNYETGASYLNIAEFITQRGANINEDLEELWRRIVFNICISNTDDHLRNHGFLLGKEGWLLSPVYDVNPIPMGAGLKLNISDTDNALSLDLAREVAAYFRVNKTKADNILREVTSAIDTWRSVAKGLNIANSQIESMQRAFNNYKN